MKNRSHSRKRYRTPGRPNPKARQTASSSQQDYAVLEQRQVLNAVPHIVDDLAFTTPVNVLLVRNTVAGGLLANDFDPEGTNLNAAKVTDPTNGSAVVYTDGTFEYQPNPNFSGVDSFEYVVGDEANNSRRGKVQITVGKGLSGAQNLEERISDNLLHSGGLRLEQPLSDGMKLLYRSDLQGSTVVPIEAFLTPGTDIPAKARASLTFGGFAQGTVEYTTWATPGMDVGKLLRFAIQARSQTGAQLPTGMHNWQMTITLDYTGTQPNLVRQYSGIQAVVNRTASEFGAGWWFDGLDRVVVQNGLPNRPDGILLVEGDGTTLWFAKNGSTWKMAEGDLTFSVLSQNGGGYRLKDKWGNERLFDADGFLTSVKAVNNDRETYRYFYDTASPKKLIQIRDQFNRNFNVAYQPGGGVNLRFTDFSGTRKTEITTPVLNPDGWSSWSATQNIDSSVPYVPSPPTYFNPVWSYTTRTNLGLTLPSSRVSPSELTGLQSLETYEFDVFGMLDKINYINLNDGSVPGPLGVLTNTDQFDLSPMFGYGLYWAYNQTITNKFTIVGLTGAGYSGHGETLAVRTNRFGEIERSVQFHGSAANFEFDSYGLLMRHVGVDPDGTDVSAHVAPVTLFGYNSLGDLVYRRNPDHLTGTPSERRWTYDPVLHVPLTETDELNQVTTMARDSVGNLIALTDPQGFVWTFIYDQSTKPVGQRHGRMEQMTSPDPDGTGVNGGPLLPITTIWEYEPAIYTLVKKVIKGDGTTREYSWTQTDRMQTEKDELGRITNYTWDAMDRLVLVQQPAATIGGPRPLWTWAYGENGQLKSTIDPENNTTTYFYDGQNQLTKVQLPDPDGSGSLARPEHRWTYRTVGKVIFYEDASWATGLRNSYAYDLSGNLIQVIGPLNNQYASTGGQVTNFGYDFRNRLIQTVDATGRTTRSKYDILDRLTTSLDHDPDGAGPLPSPAVDYGYDRLSRLTSVRDELFRQTDYFYTPNGWLDKVYLPDPDLDSGSQVRSFWDFDYDNLGRKTKSTDSLGRFTLTAYDAMNRMTGVTLPDPDGAGTGQPSPIWQYQYDLAGNLQTVTAPLSRVTGYQWDNLNRLTKITLPDPDGAGTGSPSPEWHYTLYDLVGNLKTQVDPLGRTTTFGHDNLYRQKTVTQPDPDGPSGSPSPIWTWNYKDRMLTDTMVDPLGRVTRYSHDDAGRVIQVNQPDPAAVGGVNGPSYTYTWDAIDRLTRVSEPFTGGAGGTNPQTSYAYDMRSRLVQVTDPLGGQTKYAWNDASELLRLTDPVGNATEWAYDRMGRRTLETNSLGFTRGSDYDLNSNLTRATDRNGRFVQYTRDQLDRMMGETWHNPTGTPPDVSVSTTTPGSSGVSEVQSVQVRQLDATTPGKFRLGFAGETTGLLDWNATAATIKSALEELVGIDTVSVTLSVIGATRTFTIAFNGAQSGQNVPQIHGEARQNTVPSAVRSHSWFFDNASRLIAVSDPTAIYQYTLDKLDRVTGELQNSSTIGLTPHVRTTRGYDLVNNRTSLAAEFVVGSTVTKDYTTAYLFDPLNRNYRVTQTAQGTGAGFHAVQDKRVDFQFNLLGQMTFVNRYENTTGNGTSLRSVYGYDLANRLNSLAHRNIASGGTATNLSVYAFTFDPLQRIKTINHTGPAGGTSEGLSTFSYDLTSQLTLADHVTRPDEAFSFDLNGNRNSSGYATGLNNQTTASPTAGAVPAYSYQFDKEGNRTRRTKTSDGSYEEYSWDHRNRLTKVTFRTSGGVITRTIDYSYDIFNRMVKRSHDLDGPNVAGNVLDEFFAGFDGISPTLEFRRSNGGNAGVADLRQRYLWGQAVDQLLANEQLTSPTTVGNVLWTLGDHLGTLRDIVDFNAGTSTYSVVNHRTFDVFGRISAESNSFHDVSFAWTGKYYDRTTQLSLHWHRWYDTSLGKWVSEDPIGFVAGDANLVRYVGNTPTNTRDSMGLMDEPWWRDSYWDIIQPWSWLGNVSEGAVYVTGAETLGEMRGWQRGSRLDNELRTLHRQMAANDPQSRAYSDLMHGSYYATDLETQQMRVLAESAVNHSASAGLYVVGTIGPQSGYKILAQADHLDRLGTLVGSTKSSQRKTAVLHKYVNPGTHVPNTRTYIPGKSVLPSNHIDLFHQSIVIDGPKGPVRYAREGKGKKAVYHKFDHSIDGEFHWVGSTDSRLPDGSVSPKNLGQNDVPMQEIDRRLDKE